MPPCLSCDRPLEPADREHRYCPYCGSVRVLADPPSGGPDGAHLVVGRDVLGPHTGDVYGYAEGADLPRRIDPLDGPFEADGSPWRDLFAASDAPLPELACHVYRTPPPLSGQESRSDTALGTPLSEAAVRHGRIFNLADRGQLSALDARTLEYVAGWQFPQWTDGKTVTGLHVSESLVYAALSTGGSAVLRAATAGHGRAVIQQTLPYVNPQVLIARGEVLVLGNVTHQHQAVQRYRLADYRGGASPRPWLEDSLLIQSDPAPTPRPARIGNDFVFAAADGKIYRWAGDGGSSPQVLWPNPMNARLEQPESLPLGRAELGFVANARAAGGGVSLVRIRQAPDGTAVFDGTLELPLLRDSRWQQVTCAEGTLFMIVQGPGAPIRIHAQPLAAGPAVPRELHTMAGTQEAEIAELRIVPWQDQPHVLVHYATGLQRDLWLIHPIAGTTTALPSHPPRAHSVHVLWMTGRIWQVNLTEGRITRLG